jgi:hypothetical protein
VEPEMEFDAFDKPKFKNVVLYIVLKVGRNDWFGATKLNKVLWFVDARAYTLTGKSITGETYVRGPYGPVPSHINDVLKEMVREHLIEIRKDAPHTRFIALAKPELFRFSEQERQSIDWWTHNIDKNHTAASISEETHDEVWEMAKMGEVLPLYAYRVARIKEPSTEELERLRARAKELGLV